MSKEFVGSIAELAALAPRFDGGTGVGERWCSALCKRAGITKGPNGYPVEDFLKAARESIDAHKAEPGSLDDEIKQRRIQLLDIEIGKATGAYVEASKLEEKIIARDSNMQMRVHVWRDGAIARDPALRAQIERVHDDLCGMLAEEPW